MPSFVVWGSFFSLHLEASIRELRFPFALLPRKSRLRRIRGLEFLLFVVSGSRSS